MGASTSFIRIVPQRSVYIVELLGKFNRQLEPGLHFTIPLLESVPYKLSLKETDYSIKQQEAITKDNVHIYIDGVLYLKIVDPLKAAYGSKDPIHYTDILAQSIMRAEIGKLSLDRTFEEKEYLNQNILEQISVAIEDWGVECIRYEIKDIYTQESFKEVLNAQAEAERVKRATIREAEGKKQSLINIAEGERSKVILEAEAKAREIFLNYSALAARLGLISDSIEEDDPKRDALKLSLSEDMFKSMSKLAHPSTNLIIRGDMSRPREEIERTVKNFDFQEMKL